MFYDTFCCLFVFWRDCSATVGWIFTKSSPADVFAVLFISGGTPVNIGHPQKNCWGPKTSNFWRKNSHSIPPPSDGHWVEFREKTKTTGITTISMLPSCDSLVKFGSWEFELQGLINCALLPIAPWCFIRPAISRQRQHVQNIFYQSKFADSWNYALSDGVALLVIITQFPKFLSLLTTLVCFAMTNVNMGISQNANRPCAKRFAQRRHLTKTWNVLEWLCSSNAHSVQTQDRTDSMMMMMMMMMMLMMMMTTTTSTSPASYGTF